MFGIGEGELVIIVVFAFLLFGPDKLPGMGRTLGRMLRQFREASDGFTEVVQTNIVDPAAEELQKSPKQRKREQLEAEGASVDEAEAPVGAPTKRETFAERKARLAAEREKLEAAGAASEPAYVDDEDADIEEGEVKQEFFDDDVDSDEDIEVEAPKRTTAADLYQMGGMRSSRFHASEPAAEEANPEVQGPGRPEEATASANQSQEGPQVQTEPGEEEGA